MRVSSGESFIMRFFPSGVGGGLASGFFFHGVGGGLSSWGSLIRGVFHGVGEWWSLIRGFSHQGCLSLVFSFFFFSLGGW